MIQNKDDITYLNDIEKEEVKKFANNQTLKNAIKKILLKDLYDNGVLKEGEDPKPMVNSALGIALNANEFSDEHIGRVLRAQAEGIRTIEFAFGQIEAFKEVVKPTEQKKNDAR